MYRVLISHDVDAFTAYEQAYRAGKSLRQSFFATTGQEKLFLQHLIETPYSRHQHYTYILRGFLAGLRGESR